MTIPVFPSLPGLEWPLQRSTIWSNERSQALSGKSTRIQNWTFPRYHWEASFSTLRQNATQAEFAQLMGFINSLAGGALPFYYTDADDNAVTGQEFGVGDGATTTFQLVRAFGGNVEPVQSPNGTPTITVAGTPTTSFTIDSKGVVTFASAPASAAALLWTGAFYWLCELDDDKQDFSAFMSGYYEMKKLAFTSIKL